MFGYVVINKKELKFREYDEYRGFYCGLCKSLSERYGISGQITLNYDMTFLAMLLTALYEEDIKAVNERCIIHPFKYLIQIQVIPCNIINIESFLMLLKIVRNISKLLRLIFSLRESTIFII